MCAARFESPPPVPSFEVAKERRGSAPLASGQPTPPPNLQLADAAETMMATLAMSVLLLSLCAPPVTHGECPETDGDVPCNGRTPCNDVPCNGRTPEACADYTYVGGIGGPCEWSNTTACCQPTEDNMSEEKENMPVWQFLLMVLGLALLNLGIRGGQLAMVKHTAKCKQLVEGNMQATGFVLNTKTTSHNSDTGTTYTYKTTYQFALPDGRTVKVEGQSTIIDFSGYEAKATAEVERLRLPQPLSVLYDESDPTVCLPRQCADMGANDSENRKYEIMYEIGVIGVIVATLINVLVVGLFLQETGMAIAGLAILGVLSIFGWIPGVKDKLADLAEAGPCGSSNPGTCTFVDTTANPAPAMREPAAVDVQAPQPQPTVMEAQCPRRDCHLMAPPCTFIRCFNMDKQGCCQNDSLVNG